MITAVSLAAILHTILDLLCSLVLCHAVLVSQELMEQAEGQQWLGDEPEPIQGLSDSELPIFARLESVPDETLLPDSVAVCQVLRSTEAGDEVTVVGSELLLATLEVCGVDNARYGQRGVRQCWLAGIWLG